MLSKISIRTNTVLFYFPRTHIVGFHLDEVTKVVKVTETKIVLPGVEGRVYQGVVQWVYFQ